MTLPEPAREPHRREIKSFVRREGRLTTGQKTALETHWPVYGVEAPAAPLNLAALFGRIAPTVMEIGFGNGEQLLARAAAEPQYDFIGVEVHRPGVGRVLAHAAETGLKNIRVACHDAVEVLKDWLPAESLDELLIYFPDPWHKLRHHKRRLIQPAFATLAASRLKPGGRLYLATDWANYAEHMLTVLNAESQLKNLAADAAYLPRPQTRLVSKFERRGHKLGHAVFDLGYERVG